jgi:hypothetical protein
MSVPEWLTRREGALRRGSDGQTWFVVLNGKPQYSIVPVPVNGRFAARIQQTINGQQIPSAGMHATKEEAISAGLEELRKTLGW